MFLDNFTKRTYIFVEIGFSYTLTVLNITKTMKFTCVASLINKLCVYSATATKHSPEKRQKTNNKNTDRVVTC